MIYGVIENATPVFEANFEADMRSLMTARSEDLLDPEVNVAKHLRGEIAAATKDLTHAWLCIYWASALTQAKWQAARASTVALICDYIARGSDPTVVEKQLEFAAEAILLTVDRLAGTGTILGAGEQENGTSVETDPTAQPTGQRYYQGRIIVTVPVTDEDQGL